MFSRQQWEKMDSHTSPEMLRSPLERVALLIKGMAGHELLSGAAGLGGVERVLGGCLSPPKPNAVTGAMRLLRQIGAFDGGEELTALGGHLNRMPMDPRVGELQQPPISLFHCRCIQAACRLIFLCSIGGASRLPVVSYFSVQLEMHPGCLSPML
jgi:HrpA-like RNA helicase